MIAFAGRNGGQGRQQCSGFGSGISVGIKCDNLVQLLFRGVVQIISSGYFDKFIRFFKGNNRGGTIAAAAAAATVRLARTALGAVDAVGGIGTVAWCCTGALCMFGQSSTPTHQDGDIGTAKNIDPTFRFVHQHVCNGWNVWGDHH